MTPPVALFRNRDRTAVLHELRCLLPRMEGFPAEARVFSFTLSALDSHLPNGGLAFGALHEVLPEDDGHRPAAFGFITALLGRMPPGGPLLLVMSARDLAQYGRPHGHGLNFLGLDPAR